VVIVDLLVIALIHTGRVCIHLLLLDLSGDSPIYEAGDMLTCGSGLPVFPLLCFNGIIFDVFIGG
jgi:hypothetical protein